MLPVSIPLENNSNLRDLGGWAVGTGCRVRRGLLFRGPALTGLSEADHAAVARLGLRTVIDFRGIHERAAAPVAIADARILPLPIEPHVGAGLADILRTGASAGHLMPDELLGLLRDAYVAYATTCTAQYAAMFAALLAPDAAPALLHCSAGKDRTGFAAALVLWSLGVSRADIVRDYLATNVHWRRETADFITLSPPLADALLRADERLLDAALAAGRRRAAS